MRFEGARVLLTGGSGGLGQRMCALMMQEDAKVTVMDRVAPSFPGPKYLSADLASAAGLHAAAEKAAAAEWDVLINLAGVQHFGPIEHQPADHLIASYMVNLVAPARLAQAVIPKMKARGSGRIVNVGSIFGSINFAHFATYSSAKAGLRGLSQALRRELTGTGIDVTYVAPRAVKTALNSEAVMKYATLTAMAMDEPEVIAAWIVAAIRARKNDVYFGFPESLFVRINAITPRLVDQAVRAKDVKARALFHSHHTKEILP